MTSLLQYQSIRLVAEWIWGDEEAGTCVESFLFMPVDCWTGLAAKALGILVILGSFLNKAPVMINLYNAKSVEGLSRGSAYCEAVVVANSASYGYIQGFPITAYGENLALFGQTIILIFMIWNYTKNPSVGSSEMLLVFLFSLAYFVGIFVYLPVEYSHYLMASIWPIYIFARGNQILETYKVKHSGAQSVVTIGTSLIGSLIRILTTIREVGLDFAVLTGYGLGVLLNGVMLVQYIVYKKNTEKFLRDLKKQD